MAHRIINGLNENEVSVVLKNPKKSGYFEKFFNYSVNIVFSGNISLFKSMIIRSKSLMCHI